MYSSPSKLTKDPDYTSISFAVVNAVLMILTIVVVSIRFYYLVTDNLVNIKEWILLIVFIILTGTNIFIDAVYISFAISKEAINVSPYNIIALVLFILDIACCVLYLVVIIIAGFVDKRLTLPLFSIFFMVALIEAICTLYFMTHVKTTQKSSYRYMPIVQLIPQLTMNMPYF